jgi:hypothetical protein
VSSSADVLASPPPHRRPVLRGVLTVVIVGLAAWGLVVRASEGGTETPAAAPSPPPAALAAPRAVPTGPPPWVRYPTPLEGRWVAADASDRVILVIHDTYIDVWQGVGQQQGLPLARRIMVVVGDRVQLRTPGDRGEVATYRWRISGERLSFELVDQTPKSASMLARLTFYPA